MIMPSIALVLYICLFSLNWYSSIQNNIEIKSLRGFLLFLSSLILIAMVLLTSYGWILLYIDRRL